MVLGCQSARPEPLNSRESVESVAPQASADLAIDPAVINGVSMSSAHRAVEVALTHQRTAGVHTGEAYEVADVSAVEGSTFGGDGDYIRVVIEFDRPLDPSAWPDEAVCAIGVVSEDITGIGWLISVTTESVAAYSPQWDGETTCVP